MQQILLSVQVSHLQGCDMHLSHVSMHTHFLPHLNYLMTKIIGREDQAEYSNFPLWTYDFWQIIYRYTKLPTKSQYSEAV